MTKKKITAFHHALMRKFYNLYVLELLFNSCFGEEFSVAFFDGFLRWWRHSLNYLHDVLVSTTKCLHATKYCSTLWTKKQNFFSGATHPNFQHEALEFAHKPCTFRDSVTTNYHVVNYQWSSLLPYLPFSDALIQIKIYFSAKELCFCFSWTFALRL